MKLFSILALTWLLLLAACKSSNPPPEPAPARDSAPVKEVQEPPRATAPVAPPDTAGSDSSPQEDAGSSVLADEPADAGSTVVASEPGDAGAADSSEDEAALPEDSFAARLLVRGCLFDPGSAELRQKAMDWLEGKGAAEEGEGDYEEAFDCSPPESVELGVEGVGSLEGFPCWESQRSCQESCGRNCGDCKTRCAPACDTCMAKCETDACREECARATESCVQECFVERRSCRASCERDYAACAESHAERWQRECEQPCTEQYECQVRCEELPDEEQCECMESCPELPAHCENDCEAFYH